MLPAVVARAVVEVDEPEALHLDAELAHGLHPAANGLLRARMAVRSRGLAGLQRLDLADGLIRAAADLRDHGGGLVVGERLLGSGSGGHGVSPPPILIRRVTALAPCRGDP